MGLFVGNILEKGHFKRDSVENPFLKYTALFAKYAFFISWKQIHSIHSANIYINTGIRTLILS